MPNNLTFGPYTPLRQAGSTFYISGQVGVDPDTKNAPEDVAGQTEQALKNMAALLESAGLSMRDVIKTTIFVTDIGQFATVNSVYETFFESPRPARSTVGVKELPRVAGETPLLVEIEAVAYKETA